MDSWILALLTGMVTGGLITTTAHRLKRWNKYRARRFTKKHRKVVKAALEYVSKYRTVIAYYIEKAWEHYTGEWEGFHLDILVVDDSKEWDAKRRVAFQTDLWNYIDNKFNQKRDLFYLTNVNIYNDHNFRLYQSKEDYECHWVITDMGVEL